MKEVCLNMWLPEKAGAYIVKIKLVANNELSEVVRPAYFERLPHGSWVWRVMDGYDSFDVYKDTLIIVYGEFNEYSETIIAWKPLVGDDEWT